MLLFVQVLGVLAGALVLAALVRGRVTRRSVALAAPLVPTALACALLGATLYPTARNVLAESARKAGVPRAEAQRLPGRSADAEIDFVEWVRERVGPGETFHVAVDDTRGYQWTTYRLLPNLATGPERADVIVFYDSEPESVLYDASSFETPELYDGEEGFGVARRRE